MQLVTYGKLLEAASQTRNGVWRAKKLASEEEARAGIITIYNVFVESILVELDASNEILELIAKEEKWWKSKRERV